MGMPIQKRPPNGVHILKSGSELWRVVQSESEAAVKLCEVINCFGGAGVTFIITSEQMLIDPKEHYGEKYGL